MAACGGWVPGFWVRDKGAAQGPECFSVPDALSCTPRGAWADRITLCDDHGQAEWSEGQEMAAGPTAFMQPRSDGLVQSQGQVWVLCGLVGSGIHCLILKAQESSGVRWALGGTGTDAGVCPGGWTGPFGLSC